MSILIPAALALLTIQDTPGPAAWTILIYGAVENSAEESFCPDMERLRAAIDPEADVRVMALVDRSPEFTDTTRGFGEDFHDTRLYVLDPEGPLRVGGGTEFPEITRESDYDANTADAQTLRKALRWAKAQAPAERYALVFYSHGSGPVWCPDDGNPGDELFTAELTDVLQAEDSVDLMVFDVCLMAGVENAYQWSPRDPDGFAAQVMVGTPMAGFPFPWHRIFARIGPGQAEAGEPTIHDPRTMTAQAFGQLIVEETEADRRSEIESGQHPPEMVAMAEREAMACIDLSVMKGVKSATDALARELAAWEDASFVLEELRGPEPSPRCVNYFLDMPCTEAPYFDLHHLASRLSAELGAPEALRAKAGELAQAVDTCVLASYGLGAYDDFGGFEAGKHGLYIVYPYGLIEESAAYRPWANLGWYHPDVREEPGQYGHYAWCRDGARPGDGQVDNWFELLDSWFDLTEGGGTNGYSY